MKTPSSKPKNKREDKDLYRTRQPVADSLTRIVARWIASGLTGEGRREFLDDPLYVLEPGCYDGPFLKAFQKAWTGKAPLCMTGVDIVPKPENFDTSIAEYEQLDYLNLSQKNKDFLKSEVIIGNPPFALAEQFLKTSHELIERNGMIGLVLQMGFLGSRERISLFEEYKPKEVHVLAPRLGFIREGKKNGTDMREYILALWRPWNPPATTLHWHDWKLTP